MDKIKCTCIEAYTERKLTDPNCCACSCDYNDLVDELNNLRTKNEALKLQVKLLRKKTNDILECATSVISGGVKDADVEVWAKKIKADAIREAIENTPTHRLHGEARLFHTQSSLLRYADKIERGEE